MTDFASKFIIKKIVNHVKVLLITQFTVEEPDMIVKYTGLMEKSFPSADTYV